MGIDVVGIGIFGPVHLVDILLFFPYYPLLLILNILMKLRIKNII